MSKIFFHSADRTLTIKHRTVIKQFIEKLFKQEKKQLETLNYIFCSDDYLLEINKSHLNHDYYTDIITFDLSETTTTIGEIYISLDRVKDNAITQSTPVYEESLRVIFHGALHLCGYKDKTKQEEVIMRQKEDYYIKQFMNKVN